MLGNIGDNETVLLHPLMLQPRLPVPKSCVVSLSPTFAGRDLTCEGCYTLLGTPYWESPQAINVTLFSVLAH